jgi:acyl-coenzyme A thioesterase PaaI-like protein
MCFACGLENPVGLRLAFYSVGPNEVEAEYNIPDHFQGYPGVAHGGIVAALLDEAVGRTAMIEDPNHFTVTGTLEIHYRRPIPVGERLRLVGRRLRSTGRITQARAQLSLPDGSVAAEAKAILIDASFGVERPEELGWKVAPDEPPVPGS